MHSPTRTGSRLRSKRLLPIAAATSTPKSSERPKRRGLATKRPHRKASRSCTLARPCRGAAMRRHRSRGRRPASQFRRCRLRPKQLRCRIRPRQPANRSLTKSSLRLNCVARGGQGSEPRLETTAPPARRAISQFKVVWEETFGACHEKLKNTVSGSLTVHTMFVDGRLRAAYAQRRRLH